MNRNISYKKYLNRDDIIYDMGDRTALTGVKPMVRCNCGNRFKLDKGEVICLECGNIIDLDMAVQLDASDCLYYNATTSMFVDEIVTEKGNETIATISMMALSLRRFTGEYYPTIGEHSLRLKTRLNITKRTGLLYLQKKDIKDELAWERVRLGIPYLNFTQPTRSYLKGHWDLKLPKDLILDLLELMDIREFNDEDLKEIDIYSLAWLNRVRDIKESKRQRVILSELNPYINKEDTDISEESLYFQKNFNRVKRYLASGYKPKKYDENIFEALCKAYDIEKDSIPKNLEKYYYSNPNSIRHAKEHSVFFKNRDVRINAINDAVKGGSRLYLKYDNPADVFSTKEKPADDNLKDKYRDNAISAFGNEVNIYNKLKDNSDYLLFNDTVNMINEIRKLDNSEYKIKTKGKLYDVHERASRLMKHIEAPKVSFLNTIDKENENIGELKFVFAKTPEELIMLGDETKTCVASYYRSCLHGHSRIVYLKDNGKIIGIIEINDWRFGNSTVVQVKGINNSLLNMKIQKSICKFCLSSGISIDTRDIAKSLQDEHNKNVNYPPLKWGGM